MTLTVVIADDEPPARARLRRLLVDREDFKIVAECVDGASTVTAIESLTPDLVLLDVQMPVLDGFGVLQALDPQRWPGIIFVTAFDRYALRAFEVHALDYVLKPVEGERLNEALDHARERLSARQGSPTDPRILELLRELAAERRHLTRVPVRADGRLLLVDLADVDWISAADNYVTLHVGGREHLVRDTMTKFERELDPERFVRIHRSVIVQIDRVAELVPDFHGDFIVRLKNGATLTLSRTFRPRVEQLLRRRL